MYLYILKCADNSLYTGIAANIEKRIRQHLGIIKGGAKYTKSHKPISLESL
jgi:putative endonuclease